MSFQPGLCRNGEAFEGEAARDGICQALKINRVSGTGLNGLHLVWLRSGRCSWTGPGRRARLSGLVSELFGAPDSLIHALSNPNVRTRSGWEMNRSRQIQPLPEPARRERLLPV